MKTDFKIAPSILSADFSALGDEVDAVTKAGADCIHFDVMDNHFVPNLSVGALVCRSLKASGHSIPIDVHLMADPVVSLIDAFATAGAAAITIHVEIADDILARLKQIRTHQCAVGLSLNPNTQIQALFPYIKEIDHVLLMTVEPGFGGQRLIPACIEKITALRHYLDEHAPDVRITVDGGVNLTNIATLAKAGADTFVAGSAIFSTADYAETITAMRNALAGTA